MLLVVVPWVAVAVLLVAVVARIVRIVSLPVHLRWELYPVAHEKNASYGGSFFEQLDWWQKRRTHSLFGILRVMVPEILLLEGVREHNRTLWFRSFPFHLGLYSGAACLALLGGGALLEAGGVPVGAGAAGLGVALHWLTVIAGVFGLLLTLVGALALLVRRLTDPVLRTFSSPGDILNLVLFVAVSGLGLVAIMVGDRDLSGLRAVVLGALTLHPVADVPPLTSALVVAGSALVAYVPMTHMSHFFTKWFMYHDVRWDDAPNEVGSRLERRIQEQLAYRVDWSAPHIAGGGKKTWVDVATEEFAGKKK